MKYLLDTHTFLWWDLHSARLSKRVKDLLEDPTTDVILSVVNVWEIVIKSAIGKITLDDPIESIVESQLQNHGFQLLSVELNHVFRLKVLPLHHKDPFDRLLIAQALVEDAIVLTVDPLFAHYPVKTFW